MMGTFMGRTARVSFANGLNSSAATQSLPDQPDQATQVQRQQTGTCTVPAPATHPKAAPPTTSSVILLSSAQMSTSWPPPEASSAHRRRAESCMHGR